MENKDSGPSNEKVTAAHQETTSPALESSRSSKKRKLQEEDDETGIDFDDVNRQLTKLASEEMNGRQIRNAITAARQLARFKGTKMSYVHLKHVIKVSTRFDKYLEKVKEGHTDEQFERGEGIR